MLVHGEIAYVKYRGENGDIKPRHAVVLDLYPDARPLLAVVIVGMGFAKTGASSVRVDAKLNRHEYGILGLSKTTYFHDDDMKYFDVKSVEGTGSRCPHKLFKKLTALYNAWQDARRGIEFNTCPPEVPEPPLEVIQAAIEHTPVSKPSGTDPMPAEPEPAE